MGNWWVLQGSAWLCCSAWAPPCLAPDAGGAGQGAVHEQEANACYAYLQRSFQLLMPT
jgi:hypothetical protein